MDFPTRFRLFVDAVTGSDSLQSAQAFVTTHPLIVAAFVLLFIAWAVGAIVFAEFKK